MPNYSSIQKEETLKAQVFIDFFGKAKFSYEPDTDNIDFIITNAKFKGEASRQHYLWAEAKKGVHDILSMLTQLVLTIKKTYEKGEHLPPPYIAAFDTEKIAFVPFHGILPIFTDNDVNWNITPSNHTTDDFLKNKKKIEKLSKKNIVIFNFYKDKNEIIDFINNNLATGIISSKFQINKNNFVIIYSKWLDNVKKSIAMNWTEAKKIGIIDGDFFLADLLSRDNTTLKDKLFVILQNNQYRFDERLNKAGFSMYNEVGFNDSQKAHKAFWDRYERPPLEEYWDYIIKRRDLLVPQDIRERKGSFFTPKQWVELSQKYIGDVLGENWQDEYVVWDCAAGTGNLLAGLTNKYNIWASTLDKADVDVMKDRIKNGANLLADHVFQFDFLNDGFDKLPKALLAIINNEKRRKKLIIYINPPYAEVSSIGGKGKPGVNQSKALDKYTGYLGTAGREIFTQFLTRIYFEIDGCKIAEFSKLKSFSGSAFVSFRKFFQAKLLNCFIVPAFTFDNVKGCFPIGFKIWDSSIKEPFKEIYVDVYNETGDFIGNKSFYSFNKAQFINKWISSVKGESVDGIGFLAGTNGNGFQHNNIVYILNYRDQMPNPRGIWINKENIKEASIYYAVRHCITPTWLNDRDQFLYPNDGWKTDTEFQNECLAFTIFNTNIQSKYGVNHWIPFTEEEVNARSNFESHFMKSFIGGKIIPNGYSDLFFDIDKKYKPLKFSPEAKAVFKAGKKLWQYYHAQPSANVNASLYDIREFFQGRDNSGKMNTKSGDDTYNKLIGDLRSSLKVLAEKIQPKVYEYGFLQN